MPTYRAPPDERTKGLLRILVADKFTHGQIGELADLFQVPPAMVSGSNKTERVGNLIRRLDPQHLQELVATVFGDGYVQPSMTSEGAMKAEAAVRAACVVDGPVDSQPAPAAAPANVIAAPPPAQPEDFFGTMFTPGQPAQPEGTQGKSINDIFGDIFAKRAKPAAPELPASPAGNEVFVVHGHDVAARESVARLIAQLGFKPIVLDEQADAGRTIIEKFEAHAARAVYAVVMLTADDIGASKASPQQLKPRARQNVILELGYFAARLGRAKVCAVHESGVEIPSDYAGVLYVPLDSGGAWKLRVAREMKAVGLPVDLNRLGS